MAITIRGRRQEEGSRGFTLLIAMIFVGVVLAFAATLGALGYKQSILAGNAIQSQYAFYAADAGLECLLYNDQGPSQDLFDYANAGTQDVSASCNGTSYTYTVLAYTPTYWALEAAQVAAATSTSCADLTVYKYASTQSDGKTTYLFSQGYNLPCGAVTAGNGRLVARGLEAAY
ncbi:MAG TPA: hypothetical protein VHC68_00920 [Candidatus Paceibacterota bacterium]|nr:hypothetical protein [Candidatus Paceibacterota bacterium]